MRKFFVFALFLIILLGCAKKEVKQEIKEIKVKIPPGEEKKIEPTFVSKNYQNRCYLQFLSFLSNRYNNFELDENFVASLSDEFEINELSRRKSIDRAISNYTELIKNISIPEEKNFINQRIGICKYKNGDFGSAYSILNEVYFRNKKEGIENEELNFYLALSYLSFKKDVLMAYEFLKSSSPHITTLPALDFYYLLSKVALWSGKTNEAKSYLNKAISIDKEVFMKKYKDTVFVFFQDEKFSVNGISNNKKMEIFRIDFNLPIIYNEVNELLYFCEMPALVSKPSITRFRDLITNSVILRNRYYCFYEDLFFKGDTNFNILISGIPVFLNITNKLPSEKTKYVVSDPLILLVSVNSSYINTNNEETNLANQITNDILTNVLRIALPFKYLWKVEKVEANNDEYWDYFFVGINKTNEIVFSIFDVAINNFTVVITNNIKSSDAYILINGDLTNSKKLIFFDKKEKIYTLNKR